MTTPQTNEFEHCEYSVRIRAVVFCFQLKMDEGVKV